MPRYLQFSLTLSLSLMLILYGLADVFERHKIFANCEEQQELGFDSQASKDFCQKYFEEPLPIRDILAVMAGTSGIAIASSRLPSKPER
jgi:hypothetical protein